MSNAKVNWKWHFIAFLSTLYQEMSIFFGFQYGIGSHFGPPFWTWKPKQAQKVMNIILSDLQSRN